MQCRIVCPVFDTGTDVIPKTQQPKPTPSASPKGWEFFQRLTANNGYPKLREHLGAVVTMMQLSDNWHDFMKKLDRLRPSPRYSFHQKGTAAFVP
jgi:hypothetical protein